MPLAVPSLLPLLPLIVLSAGAVAVLLASAFARGGTTATLLSLAATAASLFSLYAVVPSLPAPCTDLFRVDRISVLSSGLILFASLCITVLAHPYLRRQEVPQGEFTLLMMLATLGGLVLASSSHFASLFLGIELVGVPLAAMAAYVRRRERSIEAGFKYLVLSGASSAVLLFGMALLYAETGTLSFDPLSGFMAYPSVLPSLGYIGLSLLIAGLGFKLAVVPFHYWAPDVYEGAPAPTTIFASTVSKAAVITVLLRLFPPGIVAADRFLFTVFAILAVLSMTVGNLLALRQRNVKRMLAWSAIAHNGYLLVAFLSSGPLASAAVLLYLLSTVVTHLGAFGVVALLSGREGDAEELDDYAGLTWRRPWTAAAFSAALLSLLGLPLTAGFIAKFTIAAAGLRSSQLVLVIVLMLNTVIGAYYYLRVIMTMFLGPDEVRVGAIRHASHRLPAAAALVVLFQAALLLWIGTMPQTVVRIIQSMLL
jgi:NADH-quinone oxidoreductase subunit N